MGTSGTFVIIPGEMAFSADASNGYVDRVYVRASESTTSGDPIPAGAAIDLVQVITPIFNGDGPFDAQGVANRVYLGTRAGGLDGFDPPGVVWTADEETLQWVEWNATPFAQPDWIADPMIVYEVDASGTRRRRRRRPMILAASQFIGGSRACAPIPRRFTARRRSRSSSPISSGGRRGRRSL